MFVLNRYAAFVTVFSFIVEFGVQAGRGDESSSEPPPGKSEAVIRNSIGMKLTYIPAGEFTMGTPKGEGEQHVVLARPFYLGIFEVTRGEFRQFVLETKYLTYAEEPWDSRKDAIRLGKGYRADMRGTAIGMIYDWRYTGFDQTDEHPVVNVTAADARAFCDWLSRREGSTYRLPTESEWEYACRAGSKAAYSFGDDPTELFKHGNVMDASWARSGWTMSGKIEGDDGFVFTAPVGRFRPNAFGLFDMHGNVFEMCHVDVKLDQDVQELQLRGGAWYLAAERYCRSGNRFKWAEGIPFSNVGFRVVRER